MKKNTNPQYNIIYLRAYPNRILFQIMMLAYGHKALLLEF